MSTPNSFVENINLIANAHQLATGDVVSDTQVARDEAVDAAEEALISEVNAKASEDLAHEWADKGHNNPVTGVVGVDAEYSSYHWSVVSSLLIGDPIINDGITSGNYTWSSTKISGELSLKSDTTHLHTGVYEPTFSKGTAFNKSFPVASGTAGSLTTPARSDHVHTGVYEPKRTVEGTAYNKDFGTISGSVMQGDARFDSDYMPLVVINSAYNKNFVADMSNPQADEIPRGTHSHAASGISYDNTGTNIGSSTSQGAITEMDAKMSNITIAEASFITLLEHTQYTQVVGGQNTPTKITMPMSRIQGYKNATNNANAEVKISYDTATAYPQALVEGLFSVSIQFSSSETYAVSIAVNDVIQGEEMRGTGSIDIAQFLTNMDLSGGAGKEEKIVSVWISNLNSGANVIIESMNIVWTGNPAGALIFSGATVDHSDLSGTGAANGVHTTSDIQNLDTELGLRASKIVVPTENNLLAMDSLGDLKDSGVSITQAQNHMNKVTAPTLDNIVVMDSAGQSKDGGLTIADLALKNGNELNTFKIAASTADNEAVNQGQMNAIAATYVLDTTYQTFIARTDNPHSVTALQAGAAEAVHTHAIADVSLLQDTLDAKYDEITAVTDNLMGFGAGNIIIDTGIPRNGKLIVGVDV